MKTSSPAQASAKPQTIRPPRTAPAQRRREIVEAALKLAQFASPDSITTQAIADQVGLTQGGLFRHFVSKEAIWAAVFAWVRETLPVEIEAAAATEKLPLKRLERVFFAHVDFVARHRAVPRLLFHELQGPAASPGRAEVRSILTAYRKRVAALLQAAKRDGSAAAALDVSSATALFIGMVQGLVVQSALFDGTTKAPTLQTRARRLFPLFLDAIGSRS